MFCASEELAYRSSIPKSALLVSDSLRCTRAVFTKFDTDALRLTCEFSRTIEQNYLRGWAIREKYDGVTGSSQVNITTGYKTNEIGFGLTNGV